MNDDTTPATKADIRQLGDSIERRFARLIDSVDRILDVLVNFDKRLTHEVKYPIAP